jgi:citrate synthase
MLSAEQAARELGISRRTLYAYVSRGLLPSVPDPGNVRMRRYPASAVRRLAALRDARRDPAQGARAAARHALTWGEPVLDSAITLLSTHQFYYRGHDALALAEQAVAAPRPFSQGGQFERVAELLLCGRLPASASMAAEEPAVMALLGRVGMRFAAEGRSPVRAALAALPLLGALDVAETSPRPRDMAAAGRRMLALLCRLACGDEAPSGAAPGSASGGIAARLASCWAAGAPAEVAAFTRLFDCALVLLADHELNTSAFAARVVASAGASPYTAVAAGLAAVEGAGHAGETVHVSEALAEAESIAHPHAGDGTAAGEAAREAVRTYFLRRLRPVDRVRGFGHRLYPNGDPRARLLLQLAGAHLARIPRAGWVLSVADAFASAVHERTGSRPTVDFALTALCRAAAAPGHAPLTLFALGRTAGLAAHVIEQSGQERLLRPRSQYIGPPADPEPER